MQLRRRFKQTMTLQERLTAEANRLRQQAAEANNAIDREVLLRRAEQYDAAEHMDGYLRSAELHGPT